MIDVLGPDKADETWAETESEMLDLLTKKLKRKTPVEVESSEGIVKGQDQWS